MKIYFLLTIIGVFVGLSYIPMRTQPKQTGAKPMVTPDSLPA